MMKKIKTALPLLGLVMILSTSGCEEKTYDDIADSMMGTLEMPVLVFTYNDTCASQQLAAARQSYADASGDERKKVREKLKKYNSLIVHPTEYLGQTTGTKIELHYCKRPGKAGKECESDVLDKKVVSDFRMMQGLNSQPDPTLPMQVPGTKIRKGKHLEITPHSVSEIYTHGVFKTYDKYVYDNLKDNNSAGEYWNTSVNNGVILPISVKPVNTLQCGKLASFKEIN